MEIVKKIVKYLYDHKEAIISLITALALLFGVANFTAGCLIGDKGIEVVAECINGVCQRIKNV